MALIEIEELSLCLEQAPILHDISLTIKAGEYISIIGQNGAGKSTLIKCLAKIHTDWRGAIRLRGEALGAIPSRQAARYVSYVPQADARPLPFTVEEFVTMGRYPHLSPFSSVRREDLEIIDEALRQTRVEPFRHRQMNTLSGGERQKVFIAAAIAQGADIILLDEPTTFLDYRHQSEILHLLGRHNRERSATIVAVYHDLNSAVAWSDRVVALQAGRLVFADRPEGLFRPRVLESIFEVDFDFVSRPGHPLPLALANAGNAV